MRITMKKSEVADAVQTVAGIAPQRSTRPILYNVRFDVDKDGQAKLSATDLEVSISWAIPAETGGDKGVFLVPARKLADIVREAPHEQVSLDIEEDKVTVTSGKAVFVLNAAQAEEYPETPEFPGKCFAMPLPELAEMVDKVLFAVAKDEIRYAINGVYMVTEGKSLELTGTDGHRLATTATALNKKAAAQVAAITPVKLLAEVPKLAALMGKDTGGPEETEDSPAVPMTVEVGISEADVFIKAGDVTIAGRQLEGTYPKYKEVVPKEAREDEKVKVQRDILQAALRRAALVTTEETRSVRMDMEDGVIKVSARDAEVGTAEEEIAAETPKGRIEVAFDPRYLREGISKLRDSTVRLEVKDSESAGVVREPGYTYVLMPIRR
ncbi:MAG: DNA polymerase III subunit beta [Planctomycetes bacterium]|nr:DNA polymerase III subunit beta [Planctomycetota bacterium]